MPVKLNGWKYLACMLTLHRTAPCLLHPDDVLQVARHITEEAAASSSPDDARLIRLFDIEKAYPGVSRDTLWRLMVIKSAVQEFGKICTALHESTNYQVEVHKGMSSAYQADKVLCEGCRSSPCLFNLYHHAVLKDYRIRLASQATAAGHTPAIPWTLKID